jgi:SAM-dependent methyltransferase
MQIWTGNHQGRTEETMSQETSGVDSTSSLAAGGQPAWDEDRVAWWLANADARERQLQPVSDALFDRASLLPGERVLDVGVGSGPTTGQAWEAVRPDGSVTGIDIAPAMIAAARQRITAPEIEWIVGDAASYDFAPRSYDAVISRFGVMFFTPRDSSASPIQWPPRHSTGLAWSIKVFRLTEFFSAWVDRRQSARFSTRLAGRTSGRRLTTGLCFCRTIRWLRQR